MIKPLGDRVLIKELDKDKERMQGGILLIAETRLDHKEGTIVAVGPGRMADMPPQVGSATGAAMFTFVPMSVKVGDKVVFDFGQEYTILNEKYYLLRESDLLAIINE